MVLYELPNDQINPSYFPKKNVRIRIGAHLNLNSFYKKKNTVKAFEPIVKSILHEH